MQKKYWYAAGVVVVLCIVALTQYTTRSQEKPIIVGVANATYDNPDYGFSITYPETAKASQVEFRGYLPLTQTSLASFVLPGSMSKGTNLGEAGVYVGATSTPSIVASCVEPDVTQGESVGMETTIAGKEFRVFVSNDAGAGNFYERTSYRTLYKGFCLEFVTLLHSGNIGNYPPDTVQQFDKPYFQGILDSIVYTVRFK